MQATELMRRKEQEQKKEEVGLGQRGKDVCLQIEKSPLGQTILLSSKLFTLLCLPLPF